MRNTKEYISEGDGGEYKLNIGRIIEDEIFQKVNEN